MVPIFSFSAFASQFLLAIFFSAPTPTTAIRPQVWRLIAVADGYFYGKTGG